MSSHDPSKPMDALRDQTRILGESRMIRDVESVNRNNSADVIEAIKAFVEKNNVTMQFVAHSAGIAASTLSEVMRECYKGNWQQIIFDLDRWLEDEAKRDASPRPTEYVETRVALDMITVAEATMALGGMGLVYGPTGIGKTLALEAVRAEKRGAVLISVETIAASANGLVDSLAKALRISPDARYTAMRHMLGKVKTALHKSNRLIMIDEAHKLCGNAARDENALNVVRDLHDHTKCPILLCGTTDLVAYLEQRQMRGKEPLGQIRSRIVISRDLMDRTLDENGGGNGGEPLYTVAEIRAIFAKSKMRLTPDAVRYLQMLACVPDSGGLRTARNLVVMGIKINGCKSDQLTADMLRGAQKLLVSRRAFTLLEARIAELQPSRPMAKVG